MSLPDRFELFELVREDPACQTFRARERATGRAVEAHLLLPSSALTTRLENLEAQGSSAVLDRGSHEGKAYVVTTPLAGGFMEWLNAEPADLASAGAWRIQPAAQPPPASPPASTPGAAPGDFTRMFQLRQAPEPVAARELKPEPNPASASQHVPQPGEFTRAFQKPAVAPPAPAAGSALAGQAGEFTRMFQPPVPAPASPTSQPGEAESGRRGRISPRYLVIAVALLLAIAVFVVMRTLY